MVLGVRRDPLRAEAHDEDDDQHDQRDDGGLVAEEPPPDELPLRLRLGLRTGHELELRLLRWAYRLVLDVGDVLERGHVSRILGSSRP